MTNITLIYIGTMSDYRLISKWNFLKTSKQIYKRKPITPNIMIQNSFQKEYLENGK